MYWTRSYKARGSSSVLPMTTWEHSPQNLCYGKPSSLRQTFAISQHARHSWMQAHHSVVRSMLMPLWGYRRNLITDLQTSRRTEPLFKFLRIPSPLMCKMPLLCFKWSSLTCSATLSSKPSSGRWVEKKTSLGNFCENWTPASLSFPECSSGPCAFLGAHICVKSSSPPWTSISPSTGPDLLMIIFKPYWGSQLLPPSSQMWLSYVRGSAARSLAARSRQENPCSEEPFMFFNILFMFRRTHWS